MLLLHAVRKCSRSLASSFEASKTRLHSNFRATVDQMLLARLVEVVGEKRDDHNHEEQKDAKALKRWHSAVAATMEEKSRLKKMDERQTKSRFHLISRRDARDAVAQMQEEITGKPSPLKSPPGLGALESVSEE